jgi:hypothetical protein
MFVGRVTVELAIVDFLEVDPFFFVEMDMFVVVLAGLLATTVDDLLLELPTTLIAPKVAPAIKMIIAINRMGLDICADFPKS